MLLAYSLAKSVIPLKPITTSVTDLTTPIYIRANLVNTYIKLNL